MANIINTKLKNIFSNDVEEYLTPSHIYDIDPSFSAMYDLEKNILIPTLPNTTYYLSQYEHDKLKDNKFDLDIEYVLNNERQRSEDFKNLKKDKTNILFAGCSVTLGVGLPQELTWPKILYKELEKEYKNIGPFNSVSIAGGTILLIISNIFKFCNKYGNPDHIFLLLPDYIRRDRFQKNGKDFSRKVINAQEYNDKDKDSLLLFKEEGFFIAYSLMLMLESYCNTNNIKLYMASWHKVSNYRFTKLGMNRYFDIEFKEDESLDIDLLDSSLPLNKKYMMDARDNVHPGYGVHNYMANKLLKIFMEENKHDTK